MPQSYNGKSYYVSFTDDYMRWSTIYCISKKSQVFEKYKEFEAWLKTQHRKSIKLLQSDRGGEYMLDEFTKHLKNNGTLQSLTVHDTPEENGLAERLNRTLLEHVHAMLLQAQLPKNLWPETIHHAVWLKNRTSTRALNETTPYEMLHGLKPDLTDLPEWGANFFVMKTLGNKLDAKATSGRWLGYSGSSKGHHIYGANKGIMVERNVMFDNELLTIPNPVMIVGENNSEGSQNISNRDMTQELLKNPQHPK